MRHKCESYMLVIIFFLLAFLTFWKTPLTNLFSYFHFQNFIPRRNVQSGQSADCRNGILAPPFPRINELWNWKSRLKLCRSNTYSTTCRNGLPNLKILDAVLLRRISFQKIDNYPKIPCLTRMVDQIPSVYKERSQLQFLYKWRE